MKQHRELGSGAAYCTVFALRNNILVKAISGAMFAYGMLRNLLCITCCSQDTTALVGRWRYRSIPYKFELMFSTWPSTLPSITNEAADGEDDGNFLANTPSLLRPRNISGRRANARLGSQAVPGPSWFLA